MRERGPQGLLTEWGGWAALRCHQGCQFSCPHVSEHCSNQESLPSHSHSGFPSAWTALLSLCFKLNAQAPPPPERPLENHRPPPSPWLHGQRSSAARQPGPSLPGLLGGALASAVRLSPSSPSCPGRWVLLRKAPSGAGTSFYVDRW